MADEVRRTTRELNYQYCSIEPPTVEAIYNALSHHPVEKALGMLIRAAAHTGCWSRQLLELRDLILLNRIGGRA